MTAVDLGQLAELAFAIASAEPPRSSGRRAASHLHFALTEPRAKSLAAVKRAVQSYGTAATQQAALQLLEQLATISEQQSA